MHNKIACVKFCLKLVRLRRTALNSTTGCGAGSIHNGGDIFGQYMGSMPTQYLEEFG